MAAARHNQRFSATDDHGRYDPNYRIAAVRLPAGIRRLETGPFFWFIRKRRVAIFCYPPERQSS